MASAYDKASLVMLPNAYKDGKLYSVKPQPVYGSEKVTNGDFATDSNWTKQTGWAISGGSLNASSATATAFQQNTGIVVGKTYKATYTISNYNSGSVRIELGSANVSVGTVRSANGTYTEDIEALGDETIYFDGLSAFTGSIDNVSVKEVLVGDENFTFTRGSNISATRVNGSQLIEKGRENVLLQSNGFNNAPWGTSSSDATIGQSGYDGTNDAWLLSKTAINGRAQQNVSTSGVQTVSVYAKAGTKNWTNLSLNGGPSVYFDLQNGVLGSASNYIDANIESVGNGFYRCSVSFTATISRVRIYVADGNNDTSGTSGNIIIQDSQLEKGLAATAVIETTSAIGKAGILGNQPRLDYSGGATCPSLLLEPSRTNLIPNSEYVGSMNLQNVSATANATTSPEGVGNAYEVEPTGTGFKTIRNSVTVAANSKYTISFFYKNIDHKNIGFYDNNTAGSEIQINVQNNTFTLGSACVAGDIEDYGNGWYRAWCTFPVSSGTLANYLIFRSETNNGSYTATGSSIYVYGFQIEQGSYQTSYIPTNGTSQSRAAEVCVTGTPSTTSFGQTEGTVFCEYTPVSDDTTNISRFFRLSNSGNSNQIYMQHEASNKITAVVFNGSNQFVGQTSTGYVSVGNTYKFALAYKNGDYAFYANGVQITVGTATGLGTLAVDRLGLTNSVIGKSSKVKQGIVFNTRLTNAELAKLTTV